MVARDGRSPRGRLVGLERREALIDEAQGGLGIVEQFVTDMALRICGVNGFTM
jgi:hypothetical protein